MAKGGTLFLDEVGDLDPGAQAKLLRFLQDKTVDRVGGRQPFPVDVRVVAATNHDLEADIARGTFRRDLYHRLNGVTLRLPALRERREDVPVLVDHFLSRPGARRVAMGSEALALLAVYEFPGNVRELENLLERAFAMGAREQITLADLPSLTVPIPGVVASAARALPTLADVEKDLILKALAMNNNDKEEAARTLGISRRTIYRRLKEYGKL
jgi:DNA-binding NtrC family response regulator